ncbi:nucleolin-like [Raphanus sativus]|nr:nucleolin-like [Raphanus sativus]
MDSVFRSAREKLEKEHRESKESGKLKLERERKDKDAALRQRRAVEASQRARRLEAQMKKKVEEEKEDVIPRKGGDYIAPAIPPWISKMTTNNMPQSRAQDQDHDEVYKSDDDDEEEEEEEDAPGTVQETKKKKKIRRIRERLFRKRLKALGLYY